MKKVGTGIVGINLLRGFLTELSTGERLATRGAEYNLKLKYKKKIPFGSEAWKISLA
jgi:hypothetical protein